MKKLFIILPILICLALCVRAMPTTATTIETNSAVCPVGELIRVDRWANCDGYGQSVWYHSRVIPCGVDGRTGSWQWQGGGEYWPAIRAKYGCGDCTSTAGIYKTKVSISKSDFCGPGGQPKAGSSSEAPRPAPLPPRQIWTLPLDEFGWCWFFGGTPLVYEGGIAVCFPGSPWPLANDFCLSPSYQELKGCQIENYDVIDLSNLLR